MLVMPTSETVQILRMPGAGTEDRLRLLLYPPGSRHAPSTGAAVWSEGNAAGAALQRSIDDVAI